MKLDIIDGCQIIYKGQRYRFRDRRNEHLDWVCERTKELATFTDLELHELTSDGSCILQFPGIRYDSETHLEIAGDPTRSDGSHSTPNSKPRADTANKLSGKDRLAYVKEAVAEGLHLHRSQDDLTKLSQRVANERGDVLPPSFKTISNWMDKTGPSPSANRLSSLHHLKGNRDRRYGPEVLSIIDDVIEQKYLTSEPVPRSALRAFVLDEIRTRNAQRTTDFLEEPGNKVIRNQIALLRLHDVLKAQKGATIAYSKEGHATELADPTRPLERVEIDHTVIDIIVVDPVNMLPIGRPTVAAAIDRCTRMPFAIHVSFDPPSLQTVMECLKNGILAKGYLEKKKTDSERPWNIKKDWPVGGLPHSLVVDLARENVSEDLRNSAYRIGINEVHFMPGRSPWYKGAIERFLGTMNRQVAHTAPGTTFSNTIQKGDYDSVKRAVVTLDELYEALHKWLIDIYQFAPHGGIRRAPRKLWDELTQKYRVRPLTDRREIDAVIGRSERSAMRRSGIKLQHLTYQSIEYAHFRGTEECKKMKGTDGKVEFLYDPADLSEVRIVRANKDIIHVPISRKWEKYVKGLSIWQHRCITAYLNAENNLALIEEDFIKARVELYELMRRLGKKKSSVKGLGTTKNAERLNGTGRRSYSGDNTDIHAEQPSDEPVFAVVTPDPKPLPVSPAVTAPQPAAQSNNVHALSSKRKGLPVHLRAQEHDPYASRGPKSA